MTYALSLILWMATAQTAGEPATVVVQCPPTDCERALRAQLDEARGQLDKMRGQLEGARRKAADANKQLAKLKEESSMPDHAVATLLVSDHPDMAPLERVSLQPFGAAGMGRIRDGQVDVYVSRHRDVTMAAVVLTVRNPREAPAWEPKEAFIRTPYYWGDPPVPVAVRSSPERIRPGQTARIAVVFDLQDLRLDEPYAVLTLLRDGKWEMEGELQISDFQAAAAISGGDQ